MHPHDQGRNGGYHKESHELAGVFTSIAGLMEHLLPERGRYE